MKILADSSALYSVEEGKELGVQIIPVCVAINGETYKDYEDITPQEFLKLIAEGGRPTSSQPAIGDVMDAFEDDSEEILYLTVGDGLSGTYQNAVAVKNSIENNEHIHIVNSKSLAGVNHYLVQKMAALRDKGMQVKEILNELQESIESSVSFVIPVDFDFLRRSGRLTPVAAKIGSMIKIVPVMTQTEDKMRITPFAIKRSSKKAVEAIIVHLKNIGVDDKFIVSISHAGVAEQAKGVCELMKSEFPGTLVEMFHLSAALLTHGGPGSIVVQAVRR